MSKTLLGILQNVETVSEKIKAGLRYMTSFIVEENGANTWSLGFFPKAIKTDCIPRKECTPRKLESDTSSFYHTKGYT